MSQPEAQSARLPSVPLAYWLILAPALVAFALVSGQPLFAGLVGCAALAMKLVEPRLAALSPHLVGILGWILVALAYAHALLPFWPGALADHLRAPQAAIALTAGLAASMSQSLGIGRALLSMVMIAVLLLARNVVAYYDFTVPTDEIVYGIAFVAFVEIARSRRHRIPNDPLMVEFGLALLLAFFASFTTSSFALSCLLASLPIAGYLLRNHELSLRPVYHTAQARAVTADQRRLRENQRRASLRSTSLAFAGGALLIAAALYLSLLKAPFWAERIARAPYPIDSLATRAKEISKSSELDTQSLRDYVRERPDPEWLADQAESLRAALASLTRPTEEAPEDEQAAGLTDRFQDAPAEEPPALRYPPGIAREGRDDGRLGDQRRPVFDVPKIRSRIQDMSETASAESQTTQSKRSADADKKTEPSPSTAPSRPIAEIFDPRARDDQSPQTAPAQPKSQEPEATASAASASEPERASDPSLQSDRARSLADRIQESLGLDDALSRYASSGSVLAESLDLAPRSVASLLDESPIMTVKVESGSPPPERLYLRSNTLDTVNPTGFIGTRAAEQKTALSPGAENESALAAFKSSSRSSQTITITAQPNGFATLPLPESFTGIDFSGAGSLGAYPDSRTIDAPRNGRALTYRLSGVDLAAKLSDREVTPLSEEARARLLELPLDVSQRSYLKQTADKIGGRSRSAERFAQRAADFFARRHPYSFSVSIPDGPEHPAVRWLKHERPGLCSNYASAFTLLARSRGIPTRVVTGYATTEYEEKDNRFTVRRRDAHAWVEYLDESDRWIRFDPTPQLSEQEYARVLPFVTAGEPESLERLVEQEEKNLTDPQIAEHEPGEPAEETASPDPDAAQNRSTEGETETETETEKIALNYDFLKGLLDEEDSQPSTPAAKEDVIAAVEPAVADIGLATVSDPPAAPETPERLTRATPASTEPEAQAPESTTEAEDGAPAAGAAVAELSPEAPSSEPTIAAAPAIAAAAPEKSRYFNWIIALIALALILPLLNFAAKAQCSAALPAEIKLRTRAGQLLSEVERLIETRRLSGDPTWRDLRHALMSQRYGRETDKSVLANLATRISSLTSELGKTKKKAKSG